jgi:uncharacterized protein (UPF0212 family)
MRVAQLPAGMDCRVELEAAVPVYDVSEADDAVRIAISKTGSMLNPELNYVEIEMAGRHCAHCETETTAAFLAADEALVALTLEMSVFSVDGEQHASRIARKEIGQQLADIPLSVSAITPITDEREPSSAAAHSEPEGRPDAEHSRAADAGEEDDAELLPEFDDLVGDG